MRGLVGHSEPAFSDCFVPSTSSDDSSDASADGTPACTWRHPPSFYCPISQQCMHDPVVLADGHSYERQYISKWLEQHDTSPVSGLTLPTVAVYPNHALRNAIEEYFQQVFCAHRRAIRQSIRAPSGELGLDSNVPLLRTIDALMQCSLLVNADLSIESVLRRIMDEARTMVGAEAASVFLLDGAKQELYSTVNSTGQVIRVPVASGIAGHVALSGEPIVIHDAYADVRFNKDVDARTGFRTRNIMCVPLRVKQGHVVGVVQLINKCARSIFLAESSGARSDDFTSDDLHFVQVFASQAATAIASVQACEDLQVRRQGASGGCAPACAGEAKAAMMTSEWSMYRASSTLSDCATACKKPSAGEAGGKECHEEPPRAAKKRSGRTRQRAAKWWASVRVRTPSP